MPYRCRQAVIFDHHQAHRHRQLLRAEPRPGGLLRRDAQRVHSLGRIGTRGDRDRNLLLLALSHPRRPEGAGGAAARAHLRLTIEPFAGQKIKLAATAQGETRVLVLESGKIRIEQ